MAATITMSLSDSEMVPCSDNEEDEKDNSFPFEKNQDQQQLLDQISSETVPFFDMPHRSVSHVTICPAMHFSWHNICASMASEESEQPSGLNLPFTESDTIKKNPTRKEILTNVFGVARPGEVLAILGSSGAGKTTLLNVLAHRNLKDIRVTGSVKMNGLRVNGDYIRKVSAYVEQDDAFIGSLTVKEHLQFVALLRMGKRYSRKEQHRRVEAVMKELGLLTVADTIIRTRFRSGLSGGERKRLAFASEILTSPPVLLCDEPTSGLDSFLAFQVVQVLRKLARRKGMTVLVTIHQPSSQCYALFDRVFFMAEGQVAFSGTGKEALAHWSSLGKELPLNFNPADHFIASLSINERDEVKQRKDVLAICKSYVESPLGRETYKEAKTGGATDSDQASGSSNNLTLVPNTKIERYKSTWFQQLYILTWRVAKTSLRDPMLLYLQLYQSIIISVLTGMIYVGTELSQKTIMNINGSVFQLVVNMNFMFINSVLATYSQEVPVFVREHHGGLYRVDTYFLAKNLAELPQYTLCAGVFASILYWMSGLVPNLTAFGIYVLVAVLVQHVAISIGYAMSCIFTSLPVASSIMPIFVIPLLAFGGFYINQASLPVYFSFFRYISYFGRGYEALAINQWTHVENIPGCTSNSTTCLATGRDVLDKLSFSEQMLVPDILTLVLMAVVIRFIAFIALCLRARRR